MINRLNNRMDNPVNLCNGERNDVKLRMFRSRKSSNEKQSSVVHFPALPAQIGSDKQTYFILVCMNYRMSARMSVHTTFESFDSRFRSSEWPPSEWPNADPNQYME